MGCACINPQASAPLFCALMLRERAAAVLPALTIAVAQPPIHGLCGEEAAIILHHHITLAEPRLRGGSAGWLLVGAPIHCTT